MEVCLMNVCGLCGRAFKPTSGHPNQKYCDPKCRSVARISYKRAYDRQWRATHRWYMAEYCRHYREIPICAERG